MTVTDDLAGCDILVQMTLDIYPILRSSRQKQLLDAVLTQGNHVLENGLPAIAPGKRVNVVVFSGGLNDPRVMFVKYEAAIEATFQAPLFVLYIPFLPLEDFVNKLDGLDVAIKTVIKVHKVNCVYDLPLATKNILNADHQEALDWLRIRI